MKRTGTGLKKGPIKRKVPSPVQVAQNKEDREKMWALFDDHWAGKAPFCENCGTKIYGDNKSLYHDHLIEKSKHPELKYEIENLYLVCADCHSMKTAGSPGEKHKEAIENAKKRFNIM